MVTGHGRDHRAGSAAEPAPWAASENGKFMRRRSATRRRFKILGTGQEPKFCPARNFLSSRSRPPVRVPAKLPRVHVLPFYLGRRCYVDGPLVKLCLPMGFQLWAQLGGHVGLKASVYDVVCRCHIRHVRQKNIIIYGGRIYYHCWKLEYFCG